MELWLARICSSLLAGIAIGLAYAVLNKKNAYSTSFVHSCVLTCFLCCILAGVVADEASAGQALAFALVGMLGLIRFRTVVRDTKEFTTVFLAIVTGLSIGGNHIVLGLIGGGVAIGTLFGLDFFKFGESSHGLVRIKAKTKPGSELDLISMLRIETGSLERVSSKMADDGKMTTTYEGMLPKGWSVSGAITTLSSLHQVEEVAISRQNRFRGSFDKDDD